MLKRFDAGKYSYHEPSKNWMKIGDTEFGQIFPWRLEYNCPVHENWNIVHTGMLIPESHQIYVCSDNCLRGVILTADEMDAADRISSVMPTENEVVTGKLEEVTIDGVTDVIERLPKRPKAVELFLVCMHHLIGVDERYIYDSLKKRFPDIAFIPCYMDPIMQKVSLTPEQKQRKSMMLQLKSYESSTAKITNESGNLTGSGPAEKHHENSSEKDFAESSNENEKDSAVRKAAILGDNLRLPESSDISRMLAYAGYKIEQVQDKKTFEEYRSMGESSLFITRSALSVYGLKALAERDGKPYLYMPPVAVDSEIEDELKGLVEAVKNIAFPDESYVNNDNDHAAGNNNTIANDTKNNGSNFDFQQFIDKEKLLTKSAFSKAISVIGDTEITLDYLCFPRPLSFARRLLSEGFHVTTVFLDGVSLEEKEDFEFLKENYPDLILHSTNQVLDRHLPATAKCENSEYEGDLKKNSTSDSDSNLQNPEERKVLALGPKAAFSSQTDYFVNWIENDGNFGFDGLRKLCDEMIKSFETPKNRRDLVQRKGLHNPSILY